MTQHNPPREMLERIESFAHYLEEGWVATAGPRCDRLDPADLRAMVATIERLNSELELHRALISAESIERLAEDIAVACVDCQPGITEARHRAMVRLGERLRKPLPVDLKRAALQEQPK